jgi:shikimate kinase
MRSGGTDRIWLVGMMGSGKSTVAAALAERLGWRCVDTDSLIEQRVGQRIAALWQEQGEAAFRSRESAVIAQVAGQAGPEVVSVGGGAVLDPANREVMSGSGLVVWLRAEVGTLATRIGTGETRPALGGDPAEGVARVDAVRRAFYQSVADVVVDVDDVAPEDLAAGIMARVDLSPTSPAKPVKGAAVGA